MAILAIDQGTSATKAIIDETLRLQPATPAVMRFADTSTVLGDVEVPAGTRVVPLFMWASRDSSVFTEPDEWRPERYESDQIIWARMVSHLALMLIIFLPREGLSLFHTNHLRHQVKRSIAQLLSTGFHFSSVKFLGLAQAMPPCCAGP